MSELTAPYEEQVSAVGAALMPLDCRIAEAESLIKQLKQERNQVLAKTPVLCPCCGAVSTVSELTYFQTHWYVSPRGCTEGDYWNEGEGQTDCLKCNTRLRLNPELMALKHLFKSVKDVYDNN